MIGNLHGTVVDCLDPIRLAKFYADILGYTVVQSDSDWSVVGISEELPGIAFQQISNYVAPSWPNGDVPTQVHFDIRVDDFNFPPRASISLRARSKSSTLMSKCT